MNTWIVFAGRSVLAQMVLEQLLLQTFPVRAIVRHGVALPAVKAGPIAVAPPPQQAWLSAAKRQGIDVIYTRALHAAFTAQLPACDFILNACFPSHFPKPLLSLPRFACLNVHSSLLPFYRGPRPLFWQLRDGARAAGVSLHVMTERWDAGPVLLQQRLPLHLGESEVEIEQRLGGLAMALLQQFQRTACSSAFEIPAIPSEKEDGHYQSYPHAADYQLDPAWPAERMFNFMRGTQQPGQLFSVAVNGRWYYLQKAVAFNPRGRLAKPVLQKGRMIYIQCRNGYVCGTGI